jgi:uncharacterized membrane protein YgcG
MSSYATRTVALVAALAAVALAATVGAACNNPAVDARIEALGGETEGVEPSEYHRPGQPCTYCHGVYGGASPEIVVGGTVFADQVSFVPVEGATVVLYDAVGDVYELETNCIGNFYLERNEKVPQFPLAAEVRCPTYSPSGKPKLDADDQPVTKVRTMNSWISRDGSCASCHSLQGKTVDSTGWIFCNTPEEAFSNPYPIPGPDCPGKPPKEAGGGSSSGAGVGTSSSTSAGGTGGAGGAGGAGGSDGAGGAGGGS